MVTLDMIRKPVEGDLEAFEQFIRQKFTADGTLLSEMLDYALSARGKGIRPMTVLLSAALNAPAGQRSGGLRTLLAATLVEMIHVASLIHDDVIDESDMRRGRASVNAMEAVRFSGQVARKRVPPAEDAPKGASEAGTLRDSSTEGVMPVVVRGRYARCACAGSRLRTDFRSGNYERGESYTGAEPK